MENLHKIWCCPAAIVCAWIYMVKEKRPVRIATFHIAEGTDHVQAQVQDRDGTWSYLTEIWTGESMAAVTYGKNIPDAPEPYRYLTLKEFIDEQVKVLELEHLI